MQKLMKILILTFVFFAGTLNTGCQNQFVKESSFKRSGTTAQNNSGRKNVSLVCWNVQTFFDAVTTGTEYKEFKNSEHWTKDKYVKRLNRLCEVMTSLNPDIFVMEEIENDAVVQDIANTLSGGSWEHKKNWQYACFAKEAGSAIGCAVFSRYSILSLKTHSLDVRTQHEEQPSSRPIMQLTINTGNQELELFVNHWKSKSGGEQESEIWRDWQELSLANSVTETAVMCGDFNRSAEDFILLSDSHSVNTLLRGSEKTVAAYSPWFKPDGKFATENGSYFYDGNWERIDNIFCTGNISLSSFTPVADSSVADEEGMPVAYKVFSGDGCSDHLPLKCVVTLEAPM